jgi:hypothetical protein
MFQVASTCTLFSFIVGVSLEIISIINFCIYVYTLSRTDEIYKRIRKTEDLLVLRNIAKADPGNIQQVAASQLDPSTNYYTSVLRQAQQSFFQHL